VLDHHASNTEFGSIQLVDPSAAATAVLAAELIGRLGAPLSADVATALYVGLVTDTGSFQHSSTTPQVHALAARLLAAGVEAGRCRSSSGTVPRSAISACCRPR
jgi:bifunctional oligoribonuclease and PAP phosphatase NrnA